jgi:hypothetical protein
MAKNKVPEIQVWKLRDKLRAQANVILTLEAKVEGLTAENASLRDAIDARRPGDHLNNTRDHSR